MSARDLAMAVRRLADSAWACSSLAAGDEYALSGLTLTDEERSLLLRDVTSSTDEMTDALATACVDPTLRDATGSGVFFAAAKQALEQLTDEHVEFQTFLANLPQRR